MLDITTTITACEWSASHFLIFSANVFAPLVYYSHLLPLVMSLPLAVLILLQGKTSTFGKVFFLLVLSFAAWVLSDLVLWSSEYPSLIMFFWSVTILLEPVIYALSLQLVYVHIFQQDLPREKKKLLVLLLLPTILLLPTSLAIESFNLTNCDREVIEGPLVAYGYLIELVLLVWIVGISYKAIVSHEFVKRRREILVFCAGVAFFLLSFSAGNIVGSFSDNWTIGQYGLFGMPVFVGVLLYAIVHYRAFNVRVLAVQGLFWTMWILLIALFFIRTIDNLRIVLGVSMFVFSVLGYQLVTNVKKEIELREKGERLARYLANANARLRELDKQKTEFVSIASHQLRSPIAAITGYASLLEEGSYGPMPDTFREPVSRIRESGRNVALMIDDFLDVTRIEQGRLSFSMAPVDLSELLSSIVNQLSVVAQKRGLALSFEVPTSPVTVQADRNKLLQVFINVIDNAIKYTPHGSIVVRLTTSEDMCVVQITDTGIGIEPSEGEHLFHKFSRASNANTTNVIGSGLGLYIAKEIVRAHHGIISLSSEGKNMGTTFTVELPLAASATAAA